MKKSRQKRRKIARKLKQYLQQKARPLDTLGAKGRKTFKQSIRNHLLAAGFRDQALPVPNGRKRKRLRMVEGTLRPVLVEMVTYRNLVKNMTKKILRMSINEIHAFLAMDPATLAPPTLKNSKVLTEPPLRPKPTLEPL